MVTCVVHVNTKQNDHCSPVQDLHMCKFSYVSYANQRTCKGLNVFRVFYPRFLKKSQIYCNRPRPSASSSMLVTLNSSFFVAEDVKIIKLNVKYVKICLKSLLYFMT